MFDNKKIANIKNQVNSNDSNFTPQGLNSFEQIVPVKITSATLSGTTYKYGWQAVKEDGTNDTCIGASTSSTLAVAVCDIGKDMTSLSATFKVNDIVAMRKSNRGYYLLAMPTGSVDNLLDLTHSDSSADTKGWKNGYETTNGTVTGNVKKGVRVRHLTRSHYDYSNDLNYEYYIEMVFTDTGILDEVKQVVTVNGFETTLHEHS